MRILYSLVLFALLCSCDNNLTTIGQDFIDNESAVTLVTKKITNVGTVKIDSFATSSAYSTPNSILYMGKYTDGEASKDYSGITTAIPCFQISPSSRPSISVNYNLDSVTFNFAYADKIWGDTLNDVRVQRFDLYQLSSMPDFNYDDKNYYFYNTSKIPYDPASKPIASVYFEPYKNTIAMSRFRLPMTEGSVAMKLWDQFIFNDEDIFNNLPLSFGFYFKGLAIVPAENNNCIVGIKAQSDSLYMRFHYTAGGNPGTVDVPIAMREFQYNQILNIPSATFESLKTQKDYLSLSPNNDGEGVAMLQGMAGYMIKLDLPMPEDGEEYQTIVKAEIEFKPTEINISSIPMPSYVSAYTTNTNNELTGVVYNGSTSSAVTGSLYKNPLIPQDVRYVFNITDYYKNLAKVTIPSDRHTQMLISVPNIGNSFDRTILEKVPTLKVYYANYKL
ncbi:MAG: DUF4270 family protein [Marinifilaceae bacterium]